MYSLASLPQSRERTCLSLQNVPVPHCRQFASCPQVPGSQCDLIPVPIVFTVLRMSYKWSHTPFGVWFISLSIKLLTPINADAGKYQWIVPFSCEQCLMTGLCHTLFIPSPIAGTLACFHVGEIENEAAMNTHICFVVWTNVYISEIAGSFGKCVLNIMRNC